MDSVRTGRTPPGRGFHRVEPTVGGRPEPAVKERCPMLDVIYIAALIALFGVVSLVARGVDRL